MMEVIEAEQIEKALFKYHLELVSYIMGRIESNRPRKIVEIGSGPGTFTIPLLKNLEKMLDKFYCVDSYNRPYAQDREVLESKLKIEGFHDYVEVIEKDAKEISKILSDMDLVIGHEILCDLNREQVEHVIAACFHSLREGGLFVHSELSPWTGNRSEELLQILNKEYSDEPISDKTWFSPTADELAGIAHKLGFTTIHIEYKKIPIRFLKSAAIEMTRRWRVNKKFLEKYHEEIDAIGIEYPMEQVLYCTK
ncbi:MAG: class I SAM-dependent methyltransferase [Thermoplasmata archaeon]|nr:MAG: class I SAM-dependent methyltransferase [Thermoplasmata archaeon]